MTAMQAQPFISGYLKSRLDYDYLERLWHFTREWVEREQPSVLNVSLGILPSAASDSLIQF